MAARLRAQLAALTADLSANKISLTSTQSTLSSTQSTVTVTSSGLSDVSSNLYRVAQFDASRNATLSNINTLQITNRKVYEDKFSMVEPLGPYKIDAIPMLCKETFAMNRFSFNTDSDLLLKETALLNTKNYNEFVVFVPSNRTDSIYTPAFGQDVDNENNNLGSFSRPLEDFLITEGREALVGTTLWNKVNTFKTAITTNANTTSDASRNQYLTAIKTDATYIQLKNNMKTPYKVWNQIKDGSGDDFLFENLLDLSGVALQNVLADGVTKDNVKVTSTSWPVDASGNAINVLPIAQNTSATNNKAGLIIAFPGTTATLAPFFLSSYFGLIASLGYIVVIANPLPLMGRYTKYAKKKTMSKLFADKSTNKLGLTAAELNDASNNFYASMYDEFDVNDVTSNTNGSFARGRYRYQSRTSATMKIFESQFYQIKSVLKKLGLTNYIDFNNVGVIGISAGGFPCMANHNLLSTNGATTTFTLNDVNGNPIPNAKPYLWNIKCIIGWQNTLSEVSLSKGFKNVPQEGGVDPRNYNNRFLCGLDYLKVPYINITNDADIGSLSKSGLVPERDFYYNHQIQTLYQLTKQKSESNYQALEALHKSINILKPGAFHVSNEGSLDSRDGEYGGFFPYFTAEWYNGWYLPKYISFPFNNVLETGIKDELFYGQLEDLKSLYAVQLMCHRYLGNDFPVNNAVLASLGIKYDIAPTHCDILTDFEFVKVGPRNRISYDASYNIELETNGNTVALSVDASKNLVTDANSITFSNRKIYDDKYTYPTPIGPYQVDCIPMVVKDQFLMPKFGANRTGDNAYYNGMTSLGSSGETITISYTNNLHTDNLFNTYVAPEIDVFVPANRTNFVTSNVFRDSTDGSGTVPCVGNYSTSLEDALLLGHYTSTNTGSSKLDASMTAFKNLVQDKTTTQAARTTALNAVLNNPDYITIKNTLKHPFKVWDNAIITDSNGVRKFSYSNLNQVKTDISNNGVAIPLINDLSGSLYNVQVSDTTWPVDNSGVPTQMLPVSQNANAISGKMGLYLAFGGSGSNNTLIGNQQLIAYNAASYGYIAVACHGNPLTGSKHRFEGPKTICRALAERNTDPSGVPFISYDLSNNLLDISAGCYWRTDASARNTYFIPSSDLYYTPDSVVKSTDRQYDCNRFGVKTMISTTAARKVYQRYFYEIKCILDKLGLLQYIDLNNVVVSGLSGGGFAPIAFHQLLVEGPVTTPSLTQSARTLTGGTATVFKCNLVDGSASNVYPMLGKIKAFFNLQSNIGNDLSLVPDAGYNQNFSYVNNGLSAPVKKLLVPMITITSDTDFTSPTTSTGVIPLRDNFYNHQAQIVYQLTQKAIETNGAYAEQNADFALAKSIILYRPATMHNPSADPAAGGGQYDAAFSAYGFNNWLKGWQVPQYVQFPNIARSYDLVGSELAYEQEEDIKTIYANSLLVHRFLGNDFPVPLVAIDNLGLRYDIGPLSCDINTDFEFMKVGPKTQISYDNSYNLQITAPGLTLTSISSSPPTTIDYVNLTPVGQATIKVDASNNIVTDTKGLVLYDASGNARFKLVVDPITYAVSAVPYP